VGKAGNIDITTGNLTLTNGARLVSSSSGVGDAGNVNITAKSLTLDKSKILASISSSESIQGQANLGGNITINFQDTLKLNNGSQISAQAKDNASGGNITIKASNGFVVATPNQDNDIIATADRGQGGNISIDVERVYGFDKNRIQQITEDRDIISSNGKNDLNSSSGNPQLSGTVNINTEQLDPAKERAKTPENLVEPDETVASACGTDGSGALTNSFTVTGRGGMPPSPFEALNSSFIQSSGGNEGEDREQGERRERREQREQGRQGDAIKLDENKKTFSSDRVIPARGMTINEKGQIVLTAYPTPGAGDRTSTQSNYCSERTSIQRTNNSYAFSDRYLVGFFN
jgi:large exoprotein involved in heme utilization and adhesion